MPLTYDDIPGSWGVYSRGWPEIKGDVAYDMYVFANCYISIPYGSYVLMGQRGRYGDEETCLRVEYEYLAQLKADFKKAGKPTPEESIAYREKHGKLDEWGRRTRAPIGK